MKNNYYNNSTVRQRMIDYLGGTSLDTATCLFLTRCDVLSLKDADIKKPHELDFFLDSDLDIGRSLWDREGLIAHLDIEYVNFDFPAEPYLEMHRSFELQQPTVEVIKKLLLSFGIAPLHLVSGRGHHFVWQIQQDSRVYNQISAMARLPEYLKKVYSDPHPPNGEPLPLHVGVAYAGLALIMDYLAFRIKYEAAPNSELPVELTDVVVGPMQRGREIISIDISEYGDPLHTRMIRVPFSRYLKPWAKDVQVHQEVIEQIRPLFMIPLHEMDVTQALQVMRDENKVVELAGQTSTRIPDQSHAMQRLVADYEQSDVKKFHDWFYSQEHEPTEVWHKTYDQTPMTMLSPCVSRVFENPNPLLLRPSEIQLVVRTFMALGWHPRHIAGLLRSKYERDYDWGEYWLTYDAGLRADFYVRLFSGLFATGRDDLVDYNCLSTQEKGLCSFTNKPCRLENFRESLLQRRNHERLASRPFNRLFLPEKHL